MGFRIDIVFSVLPSLAAAAGTTLVIAFCSMAAGLLGAIGLTVAEKTVGERLKIVFDLAQSLVFGTPPLVMILSAYYLPAAIGINLGAYGSGIAALATFSAFFIKEALRGTLLAIPAGLIEAALSLGLKGPAIWLRIILPLVLRAIIPPLVSEFTLVVKATALLSAVTVTDVMRTAQQIYAVNYQPIETLLGAAIIYAAINLTIAFFGSRLEAHFAFVTQR